MSRIYKSSFLNILANKLIQDLETTSDDPLIPQTFIVPNLDTARWLKLYIAQHTQIAANLEFLLPSEWQYRMIREIHPDLPKTLPSDLLPMSWSIFKVLKDSVKVKQFPKLHSYLASQPQENFENSAWQLSRQISSVFDEYIVYRPDLIQRWETAWKGSGDEQWQSDLWRLLKSEWALLEHQAYRKSRTDLYVELLGALSDNQIGLDKPLFVFNPGLLPISILSVLQKTAETVSVFLYYLQPTRDEVLIKKPIKNSLLNSFKQESLAIQQTVEKIYGNNHYFIPAPELPEKSVLQHIKKNIVDGQTVSEVLIPDGTVQVRSCHTPLREIETLHQFLLECFEADEDLNPDDVLVVSPDPMVYKPYVNAVFSTKEEGVPHIPWHLGSLSQGDQQIEKAIRRLLNVIDSRFSFSDVMDLFLMEPIRKAYNVSDSGASIIKQWMQENNVIWGLSSRHRKEWGQPDVSSQTWQSALNRGWFGQLMSYESGELMDDTLLYNRINTTSEKELWASFSRFMYELEKYKTESTQNKTITEWGIWFEEMVNVFLSHSSNQNEHFLHILIDKIRSNAEVAEASMPVSFSLIRHELLQGMENTRSTGALFTRGVTFSSMVPVRGIPAKIIALIGLNESVFPRKLQTPDFNLMAQFPKESDRNRKREDRNLFLESVLAAEKIHYCSYIGQSPVDNEPIPPSSVVSTWTNYLADLYQTDRSDVIKKEALNSFSSTNFLQKKNYSELNTSVFNVLSDQTNRVTGINTERKLPVDSDDKVITINNIVQFYKNPIRWFLRNRFDTILSKPSEEKNEFQTDALETHILFQRVFGWYISGASQEQMIAYLTQSGALPIGWPGEQQLVTMIAQVKKVVSYVDSLDITVKQKQHDISVDLSGELIRGSLLTYADNELMDIIPSSFSGSLALQGWVRHLFWLLSDNREKKETTLICDFKKGTPTLVAYKNVLDPRSYLQDLVSLFKKGRELPLHFFPKTLYTFEKQERKNRSDSFVKATQTFEGGDYLRGEREDLPIQVVFGKEPVFKKEFISDEYRTIVQAMMDHTEVTS